VYVRSDRTGDAEAIAALRATITRVGNLESVTLVASEADLPPCAIAIIEGRTVLAPFARLVDDVSAEIARLEKRRAKAGQERDKCAAKLGNASFVGNAPAEVVTQERDRLGEFERQLEQLGEQLRRLESVRAAGTAT
jgi:valyl-tRNA synthetase